MKNLIKLSISALLITLTGWLWAETQVATLRGTEPLNEEPQAPAMAPQVNDDQKQQREFPMQPPIIPHKTEGYQVDLRANKCLSCHARSRTEESGAPMVSVTHYQNREGQYLADVSPARFFCTQCHVTQDKVSELVNNEFIDMESLLREHLKGEAND